MGITREQLLERLRADLADQFEHCDVDDIVGARGIGILDEMIDEWKIYSAIRAVFRHMMATWDVAQKQLTEQVNELFSNPKG